MQHGELRSHRGSRLVSEFFLQFSFFNINDTFKTGEALCYIFFKFVFVTSGNIKWQWDSRKRGSKCNWFPPVPASSEIPEWLKIQENFGGWWSSWTQRLRRPFFSWSVFRALQRREDLGKHSVDTHFPTHRNCEICQRTKITRAPCRRRNGGAVPRADNFGDLITADHKVLSQNCESRNSHRYAVVVQDLAT